VRFITFVLSQNKGTLLIFKAKSSSCYLSQRICAQQLPAAMYSTSAVERATQACFLLCKEIRLIQENDKCHLCFFGPAYTLQNQNQNIQLSV